ncbi:hypothetical protein ONE63_011196 [Megalurothrips usitatus]|uniref:Uncharacterized protein n=1 Tax=Megalurothrips usitatus TaxID=439358 RepID=A0AAV7X347_9NEOP|nr:hypothetical protein ONE63_011196 [Megalurothrips usitatus]
MERHINNERVLGFASDTASAADTDSDAGFSLNAVGKPHRRYTRPEPDLSSGDESPAGSDAEDSGTVELHAAAGKDAEHGGAEEGVSEQVVDFDAGHAGDNLFDDDDFLALSSDVDLSEDEPDPYPADFLAMEMECGSQSFTMAGDEARPWKRKREDDAAAGTDWQTPRRSADAPPASPPRAGHSRPRGAPAMRTRDAPGPRTVVASAWVEAQSSAAPPPRAWQRPASVPARQVDGSWRQGLTAPAPRAGPRSEAAPVQQVWASAPGAAGPLPGLRPRRKESAAPAPAPVGRAGPRRSLHPAPAGSRSGTRRAPGRVRGHDMGHRRQPSLHCGALQERYRVCFILRQTLCQTLPSVLLS